MVGVGMVGVATPTQTFGSFSTLMTGSYDIAFLRSAIVARSQFHATICQGVLVSG